MIEGVFEDQESIVKNDLSELNSLNDRMVAVHSQLQDFFRDTTPDVTMTTRQQVLAAKAGLKHIEAVLESNKLLKRNINVTFYLSKEIEEVRKNLKTFGELCVEDLGSTSTRTSRRPYSLHFVENSSKNTNTSKPSEETLDYAVFKNPSKNQMSGSLVYSTIVPDRQSKLDFSPPPLPPEWNKRKPPSSPTPKKKIVYRKQDQSRERNKNGGQSTRNVKSEPVKNSQFSFEELDHENGRFLTIPRACGRNSITSTPATNKHSNMESTSFLCIDSNSDDTQQVQTSDTQSDTSEHPGSADSGFESRSPIDKTDEAHQKTNYKFGTDTNEHDEDKPARPMPRPRTSLLDKSKSTTDIPTAFTVATDISTLPHRTKDERFCNVYNLDGVVRDFTNAKEQCISAKNTGKNSCNESEGSESESTISADSKRKETFNMTDVGQTFSTHTSEEHKTPWQTGDIDTLQKRQNPLYSSVDITKTKFEKKLEFASIDARVSRIAGMCVLESDKLVLTDTSCGTVQLADPSGDIIYQYSIPGPYGCCLIGESTVAVTSMINDTIYAFRVENCTLNLLKETKILCGKDTVFNGLSFCSTFLAIACLNKILVLNEDFSVRQSVQPVLPGKQKVFYKQVMFSEILKVGKNLHVFGSDFKRDIVSCTDVQTCKVEWTLSLNQPTGLVINKLALLVASKSKISVMRTDNGQVFRELRTEIPSLPHALAVFENKVYISRKSKSAEEARRIRIVPVAPW